MFAKIFDSSKYGQILVKQDTDPDDGKPEVRFYVKPDGLGVCSGAIGFKDSDAGWELCDKEFDACTLESSEQIVESMFGELDVF